MIAAVVLLGILVLPLPWEVTFAVALFKIDGRDTPQWVRRGPHFRQPFCAIKGRCNHA